MKRLRRFFLLSPAEQSLLVRAALWLSAIRVALWLLPYPTLQRLLTKTWRLRMIRRPDQGLTEDVNKVLWAVTVVRRYLPGGSSCLTQAMVVQLLLRQCGYSTYVRIGVARTQGGRLEAHAWVENGGQAVFGGSELSRYTPLMALEGEKQ